jgi:hypothetical protein
MLSVTFCGRTFSASELALMRQIVGEFSALGECRQLLEWLAAEGVLSLPPLRPLGRRGPRKPTVSEPCPEPATLTGTASECEPLELLPVEGQAESRLCVSDHVKT